MKYEYIFSIFSSLKILIAVNLNKLMMTDFFKPFSPISPYQNSGKQAIKWNWILGFQIR